jgi:hypothetical protein
MAKGDPPLSPWTFYDSGADYLGRHITATVTFSGTVTRGTDPATWTNPLTGGTVVRDAGCQYTKVIVGPLNPDGTPSAQAKVIDMSGFSGSKSFSKAQLNSIGLVTLADVANVNLTAS